MKLYHAGGSPNSRRVRILIAEKRLDIDLVPIDLGSKEQFSDAYRAINSRVVVPTLVLDDGTAIGEPPVIMRISTMLILRRPCSERRLKRRPWLPCGSVARRSRVSPSSWKA
jgi:glutathione S-transferase